MKHETNLQATLQTSYYGKAKTRREDAGVILRSYQTDVAMIDASGVFHRLWSGYSATTMRHINDFRRAHGMSMISKKEWLSIPCENEAEVYNVYISTGFTTHKCPALLTEDEAQREITKIKNNDQRGRLYTWYD